MDENISMAGLRLEFCSHAARVMSFKSKKTLPKASRWPHPQSFPLTAEVLASAGYFHDPADNEPDRTTCWMCGESMKGWAEDDDPWELHLTWSSKCPFARIALLEHQRDTQTPSWSDSPTHSWGPSQEWFPRGSTLIEARLATFGGPDGPWKHEGKNGVPTRLELARAGFHFTPNLFKKGRKFDVDDTTSCCYCHRSVTEWEVDDDPVSVHLKKGACIFFTAVQPTENAKKTNAKQAKKPPKNLDSGPSSSIKASAADSSVVELNGDSVIIEKSSRSKKKPSSTASSAVKTGRRVLASSISGAATAANESMAAEPEESVQLKPSRASRKAPPVSDVPRSPEPATEQTASKPPVALGKSTRLSRSTSKAASASTSNRSTTSHPAQRPRTRASSNASSTIDNATRQTINQTGDDQSQPQTEDEEVVAKPKKSQRQKKPVKPSQPSSALGSESEDYRPARQLNRSQNTMADKRELSTVGPGDESRVEEEITTKKTRVPGKKKAPLSQSLSRSEAPAQPAPKERMKSPEIGSPGAGESSTRPKALMPSLFPGFNPQAPQLYPTLLPIAAKIAGASAGPTSPGPGEKTHKLASSQKATSSRFPGFTPQAPPLDQLPAATVKRTGSTAGPTSPRPAGKSRPVVGGQEELPKKAAPETAGIDDLLEEYLAGEPGKLPEGWLPNPYNPSRPFPPLTAEEAQMPLNEYFAYRARQEEEAFAEWVELKMMQPWLQAVQRGQQAVQALVDLRKSRRTSHKNSRPKTSPPDKENVRHVAPGRQA
ncbi:hypothetical protein PTTG_04515 [Puccinia triticina 1-1 BBBD Race 1]|uniref:Inhibitor of apoptosis repeat-containing protein n=1 Tax=Puccinia triticina (isolate 1-1 / race 1 (BBBD)) TaxID=630390 RepID=A0A180H3S6_PUCT1|nr:hypothetical protein PTTG_04515 [Puccinia triticina 1-1 BBBD Race 1]